MKAIQLVVIWKPSQEEMLTAFLQRGLQFQENVIDYVFKSLQKCEIFYKNCFLYNLSLFLLYKAELQTFFYSLAYVFKSIK